MSHVVSAQVGSVKSQLTATPDAARCVSRSFFGSGFTTTGIGCA